MKYTRVKAAACAVTASVMLFGSATQTSASSVSYELPAAGVGLVLEESASLISVQAEVERDEKIAAMLQVAQESVQVTSDDIQSGLTGVGESAIDQEVTAYFEPQSEPEPVPEEQAEPDPELAAAQPITVPLSAAPAAETSASETENAEDTAAESIAAVQEVVLSDLSASMPQDPAEETEDEEKTTVPGALNTEKETQPEETVENTEAAADTKKEIVAPVELKPGQPAADDTDSTETEVSDEDQDPAEETTAETDASKDDSSSAEQEAAETDTADTTEEADTAENTDDAAEADSAEAGADAAEDEVNAEADGDADTADADTAAETAADTTAADSSVSASTANTEAAADAAVSANTAETATAAGTEAADAVQTADTVTAPTATAATNTTAATDPAAQTAVTATTVEQTAAAASAYTAVSYTGQDVVNYAVQFLGNPYVYGGTSLTKGTDCSGFVMKVYENFGISLPHSSRADRNVGTDVGGLENAQPGDIICYSGHVGIYIGDGLIVHASTEKTGIIISSATYRKPVAVRRVLN